jgi:hypothetical protein
MWGKIVLAHRSADHRFRKLKSIALRGALVAAPIALAMIFAAPKAEANPNFARQTGRNCSFCHSGVPRLNDTGLAFKNNGFVLPETNKPPDKDHKDAPAQ